jgi:hypothetical protein
LLTTGDTGRQLVATADDLGRTARYRVATIVPSQAVLSDFTLTQSDQRDYTNTAPRFVGTASVPATGSYTLTATFTAPDGTILQQINQAQTLTAGTNPVTITVDPPLVTASGPGSYTLTNITLTPADGTADASASDVTVTLGDACQTPPDSALHEHRSSETDDQGCG